jgi:hypothetical protein
MNEWAEYIIKIADYDDFQVNSFLYLIITAKYLYNEDKLELLLESVNEADPIKLYVFQSLLFYILCVQWFILFLNRFTPLWL